MSMQIPKQITKTLYIHYNASHFDDDSKISILDFESTGGELFPRVLLGKIEVTFDIPQDVNVVEALVDQLKKQKAVIAAKAHKEQAELDRKIHELLALPAMSDDSNHEEISV